MELDPSAIYSMPLITGPLFDQKTRPGRVYGELVSLSATFKTDPEAVRRLVPDSFTIPESATVTVSFGDNNRVDFMAGGGYRIGYVGVSARFEGAETVDGLYILVMWENQTLPIVTGREMIGIPKLHADITSIRSVEEGSLRATAAVWGHEVMRIEVGGLREQNLIVRKTAQKRVNAIPWLGYKYIASFDGPPDASYPMVVWNDIQLDQLWLGDRGSVGFGIADNSDIDQLAAIPAALRTLPLGELEFASYAEGSAILRLDRSHRLH